MASLNVDETHNAHTSEHKTEAQGGERNGGPSGARWSEYLAETQEQDKAMVEMWKGEADNALIFAGLFSAVVAVSMVESYKWLSSDPSNETIKLLTLISQQLVNISNGIPLESIAAESNQPFKRSSTVVLVNVTWFGSIVLCLASSVFATLIQQWARRYLVLTQRCGAPHERARLRTFMFKGLKRFGLDRLLNLLPISLHTSILLYCVGLINYIFSIDTNMGFFASGYLIYFYLEYATVTVLPLFYFDCPYVTPFSAVIWWLIHASLCGIISTIRGIVDLLFHALSTLWPRTDWDVSRLAQWRERLKRHANKHRQWHLDGLQRCVELCATEPPQAVDASALEWTLTALVENDKNSDEEIEGFAAWVPEFFDTYAQSGASEANIPFMSDKPPTNPIFGFRLHHLLKICILGSSALTEEGRKRRLQVCLKCLWCWVKAYNQNSESLPSYFPLPDPDMTRRLQTEQDPTAGTIGRCFGALVAKKLAADVNLPHSFGVVRDAEPPAYKYLSVILGRTSMEVETFLSQPGAIGLANIISLTSNTLDTEKLPSEVLDIFRTTVEILLAEDFLTSLNAGLPPDLVADFYDTYSNALRSQAPDWLTDQLGRISEKLSVANDAQRARTRPRLNLLG